MTNEKYNSIPAKACILTAGEFELGTNGEGSKSAPIRLTARSGKPIEHYYWGRVVHDLAGMHLRKPRLAIDYVHDSKEVIGYLNHFDSASGDLVVSGALVPFKENDRATEIIHKQSNGVPYEASINFGGDGIKVQEVMQGQVVEVNGYQFEGPGVVIREWPLRGVAVCPYGSDANTESALFGANDNKVFHASVVTEPETTTEGGREMTDSVDVAAQAEAEAVEVEAAAVEVVAQVETEQPECVEALTEPEAQAVEGEVAEQPEAEEMSQPISREEFTRIADEFGAEVAVKTVRDGGNYETALRMAYDAAKAEIETLKAAVELKVQKSGGAVPVTDKTKKKPLFNTGL
jgi:hypothetical protein